MFLTNGSARRLVCALERDVYHRGDHCWVDESGNRPETLIEKVGDFLQLIGLLFFSRCNAQICAAGHKALDFGIQLHAM